VNHHLREVNGNCHLLYWFLRPAFQTARLTLVIETIFEVGRRLFFNSLCFSSGITNEHLFSVVKVLLTEVDDTRNYARYRTRFVLGLCHFNDVAVQAIPVNFALLSASGLSS